jgi:hypothetical protein
MSVNRNILKNSATPLSGDISPTEVNLVTTSGSRWVILDFLNTVPTASNGSCTAVTLEWSPDPSMVTNPYQPSSSYYAVTSSVFSCQSASLQPQTGSLGWLQFIDSYWPKTQTTSSGSPTEYYLRAYQTRQGSPISIYSPTVAVETRANKYCGPNYTSSIATPYLIADMDGYDCPGFEGKWMNDIGNESGPNQSGSWRPDAPGESVYLIKAGGPNYDAFRSDSVGVSWPQLGIISGSSVRAGVGIVKGRAEFTFTSNGNTFRVEINALANATTASINVTKPSTAQVVAQIKASSLPLNLVNTYVELILNVNGFSEIRVDNVTVSDDNTFFLSNYGAAGTISLPNPFGMGIDDGGIPPLYGIIRVMTAQIPYDPVVYHCKYGPVGAGSYT